MVQRRPAAPPPSGPNARATSPPRPCGLPRRPPRSSHPAPADMTFVRPANPPAPSDRGQVTTDYEPRSRARAGRRFPLRGRRWGAPPPRQQTGYDRALARVLGLSDPGPPSERRACRRCSRRRPRAGRAVPAAVRRTPRRAGLAGCPTRTRPSPTTSRNHHPGPAQPGDAAAQRGLQRRSVMPARQWRLGGPQATRRSPTPRRPPRPARLQGEPRAYPPEDPETERSRAPTGQGGPRAGCR